MNLNLKLDDREHSQVLKEAFQFVSVTRQFDYEIAHLEIGDVQCGNVVIERKEANDFVSSIMDGRLSEQARKMNLGFEHRYIVIEGDVFNTGSMISENAIIGKMTSLLVKHKIGMIFVQNELQFVEACHSLIKKHIDKHEFDPSFVPHSIPKKTDEEILAMMLMTIKGVSYAKAKDIAELYDNSLYTLVNNANSKRIMTLNGIGKVLANRIVEFVKK